MPNASDGNGERSSLHGFWSSKLAFILAVTGSAVGLGNIWKFPYIAGENGGGAFVLIYLLCVFGIGLPIMMSETMLGRRGRRNPVTSMALLGEEEGGSANWGLVGLSGILAGFLILSFYSVIAGWTVRYAVSGLTGFSGDAGAFFGEVATGLDAIAWHLAFMAVTVWVVAGGIRGGIEKVALVLMPALFGLVVLLAIYAATLEGGGEGYKHYLSTDFSQIWDRDVLSEAAGQAFFSLSLGMGAMLTYASYLGRDHHLPNESVVIAGADMAIAFIAGLVVFPLIFALGLSAQVGGSTVGALFITLPQAFAEMGDVGRVVGFLFFATLIVGALTSAISLLEVVVASAIDGLGWSRQRAAIAMGVAITLLGIPSAWSTDVLGVVDGIANNLFLLGGGLALSLFVGWVMPDPVREVRVGADGARWFFLWRTLLRFAVPLVLAFVLYGAIPDTYHAVAGLFSGS